jgi:hypothetical protein
MRETMTLSLTCQCIQYQNKLKEKKEIDQRMFLFMTQNKVRWCI